MLRDATLSRRVNIFDEIGRSSAQIAISITAAMARMHERDKSGKSGMARPGSRAFFLPAAWECRNKRFGCDPVTLRTRSIFPFTKGTTAF
jgi:hypothetical protein